MQRAPTMRAFLFDSLTRYFFSPFLISLSPAAIFPLPNNLAATGVAE